MGDLHLKPLGLDTHTLRTELHQLRSTTIPHPLSAPNQTNTRTERPKRTENPETPTKSSHAAPGVKDTSHSSATTDAPQNGGIESLIADADQKQRDVATALLDLHSDIDVERVGIADAHHIWIGVTDQWDS